MIVLCQGVYPCTNNTYQLSAYAHNGHVSPPSLHSQFHRPSTAAFSNLGLYLLSHHGAWLPLNFHLDEELRTVLVCCRPPASSLAHTLPATVNLVLALKVWHFSFRDHRKHVGYFWFCLTYCLCYWFISCLI
jgi:hypothetical protein